VTLKKDRVCRGPQGHSTAVTDKLWAYIVGWNTYWKLPCDPAGWTLGSCLYEPKYALTLGSQWLHAEHLGTSSTGRGYRLWIVSQISTRDASSRLGTSRRSLM